MKKLVSFGLSILLMIVGVLFGLRILLSEVLLNEEFYRELQQDVKLAETILEQVTTDLQMLMRTNNLPEELVVDLVPLSDIETAIQLQTTETIELLKGNQKVMTELNPEAYIWELEPRIMTYLNESGYVVEESCYEDLSQIVNGVYDITKGNVHIFNIFTLIYSGTVTLIATMIQFIMGSLPLILGGIILVLYILIWKTDMRQVVYWLGSSLLTAGVFGLVMLSQVKNDAVGLSVNFAFNQAITNTINHINKIGNTLSFYFVFAGICVILFVFTTKFIKNVNNN